MLFNSYEYIFVFLPITFGIYFFLQHRSHPTAATLFLVISSLFFYSWWNPVYLPLISGSIVINYYIGQLIRTMSLTSTVRRKSVLATGIILNLTLLGYFKYADFLIENSNYLFENNSTLLNLALPLAISFFTFQQIAYLVDCYRSDVTHRGFLNYAAFVSFFPQLIAGPIVHNKEMMPQFASTSSRLINFNNIALGLYIFSIGLFKKVVIADTFAVWANAGFSTTANVQLIEAWITSLSYTFQLYFDFSGYTDMAIGTALLFNIKLPENFNSPYKAKNLQDFWRRWHITLSRFLRDYLYIPLGGNRNSEFRTYTNLLITFILGGLWHGAGWTFIFWGFLHGAGLCIHRAWSNIGFRLWSGLAWFITFIYVVVAWVFFRAESWSNAVHILKGLVGLNGITIPGAIHRKLPFMNEIGAETGNPLLIVRGDTSTLPWILAALLTVLIAKNTIQLKNSFQPSIYMTVATAGCLIGGILMLNRVSEFLYFNF